ncbi:MAG: hypothetical protein WBG17_08090, partial [Burkholderiaceae bacterium]
MANLCRSLESGPAREQRRHAFSIRREGGATPVSVALAALQPPFEAAGSAGFADGRKFSHHEVPPRRRKRAPDAARCKRPILANADGGVGHRRRRRDRRR